jgi:hypothetical protein
MITIWKMDGDSWILICESSEPELASKLEELRADGSIYRAEIKIESSSSILEA